MHIKQEDILGARIVAIHQVQRRIDGWLDSVETYFTVDRGFSFQLPQPGRIWETQLVPEDAEKLPEIVTSGFLIKTSHFTFLSDIKHQYISKILIEDVKGGSRALLLLDNGSQIIEDCVAPSGTGAAGIHYIENDEAKDISKWIDYFSLPINA